MRWSKVPRNVLDAVDAPRAAKPEREQRRRQAEWRLLCGPGWIAAPSDARGVALDEMVHLALARLLLGP